MALLTSAGYDPATAGTFSVHALSAMTAIDTTNLRLTFTAPANGTVQVRIRTCTHGSTTTSQILLGVLEGSTVVARQSPACGQMTNLATARMGREATFVVSGLSAGSHTWDAACAVQVVDGSSASNIRYGGPDNTTANDAWGSFEFEIWDAADVLASALYDPVTAVSEATTALLAMTAVDTTNLRLTFTAPASGNVLVKMRAPLHGSATCPGILMGILEGATVVARQSPMVMKNYQTTPLATTQYTCEAIIPVTGLSAGSHSWDAAYGVETTSASTGLKYGGPNNTTGNNAWGGFAFEVWTA